eukprot:TRINITY_DN571_c0_g1_i2.p2 TRINITY_DN571_c0_g1~~TRINITY_DN571_c0_g1_i2.p2  ORF type:complete len:571 (+),score=76.08 TRINITY_DN571_c0_g1_i2:1432-3144(+)
MQRIDLFCSARDFFPHIPAVSLSVATLIVCPKAIVDQWRDEFAKHLTKGVRTRALHGEEGIGDEFLSVLFYEGFQKTRDMFNAKLKRPSQFNRYDVVLTSYADLRADFHHVKVKRKIPCFKANPNSSRSLYRYIRSPLIGVDWWRICMDESQMFRNGSAGAAKVLQSLSCVHKWAISGTPIQKGLLDIHGICLFLGVEPHNKLVWFRKNLLFPFADPENLKVVRTNILFLLKSLMWRNTKESVELALPQMSVMAHKIPFDETERYIYEQRLTLLRQRYDSMMVEASQKKRRPLLGSMLPAILSLRQLCCHPQLGNDTGFKPLIAKKTQTMEELLEKLIESANGKMADAQRAVMNYTSTCAALQCILENDVKALELYSEVLAKTEIPVDTLQKIHALTFSLQSWKKLAAEEVRMRAPSNPLLASAEIEKREKELTSMKEKWLTVAMRKIRFDQQELNVVKKTAGSTEIPTYPVNSVWNSILTYIAEGDGETRFGSSIECSYLKNSVNRVAARQLSMVSLTSKFHNLDSLKELITHELRTPSSISLSPYISGCYQSSCACRHVRHQISDYLH